MSSFRRLLRNARFLNHTSPTEQMLINFRESTVLDNVVVGNDQEIGGFSTSDLTVVKPEKEPQSTSFGRFHGTLSLDLPENRPDITRSGYAMFRTKELIPSLFGFFTECWDWKACTHMMLRVRGDRRKYFINVQAESALRADLYQHRMFLKTPGTWETIIVPLSSFILTNWGVIQQQIPMNKDQVRTVGIGLTDRQYGPFCLDIDWIKVVNEDHIKAMISGLNMAPSLLPTPGKRLSIDDFK